MKPSTFRVEIAVKPSFVLLAMIVIFMVWTSDVLAYEQYAASGNNDCESCHGNFTTNPYVPPSGGTNWSNSLHTIHQGMVSNDCDTCHSNGVEDPGPPVLLEVSDGGNGLATIGCVGCHGRDEDISASSQRGAGLRQHHAGVTSCTGCHSDQTGYTPVGENVLPNYYANAGTGHPNMPTNSCNLSGSENFAGSDLGLDNDGDGDYDAADSNCTVPVELMTFEIE